MYRYCTPKHMLEVATYTLSSTVSVNDMAWVQEGQCLNRTRIYECSESPDEISNTRAHSQWHNRTSCDGQRHLETQYSVKTQKIACDLEGIV